MGQCPHCGTPTSTDHAFCLSCGAEVDRGREGAATGASASAPEPQDEIVPPAHAPAATEDEDPSPTGGPSAVSDESSAAATPVRAGGEELPSEGTPPRTPARPAPGVGRGGRGRSWQGSSPSSWLPAAVALVASLAFQQLITSAVPPTAYIHRLFRPAGGWQMSVVPALIAFALLWTITDLFLKWRVARVNERDLARSDVNQIPSLVAQEPPGTTLRRLRAWDGGMQARPVGRRILWLLQHMETNEAQRAHELMRHQSDLDGDQAASGYRTVKLFIWAMPILGFIGTVLGISLAVGGFSEFLTTSVSIDQIDAVTAELGNVASGLSFAFDTTLLGLLGGLIASVISSGVQAREERLLTRIDELGLRIMETADPTLVRRDRPSPAHAAGAPGDEFDRMMQRRLGELSTQMDHFTGSVQAGLDGFMGEWAKLPDDVHKVAKDLDDLRAHLSSAAKGADQVVLETRMLLEGLHEASSDLGGRVSSSIGSIGSTVEGFGANLSEVSQRISQSVTGLNERLAASDEQLRSAVAGIHAAMERSHRDAAALAESDAAAERAFQGLSASIEDLGAKLVQFGEVHAQLVPVLKQLSQPMELRLIPAAPPPPPPAAADPAAPPRPRERDR